MGTCYVPASTASLLTGRQCSTCPLCEQSSHLLLPLPTFPVVHGFFQTTTFLKLILSQPLGTSNVKLHAAAAMELPFFYRIRIVLFPITQPSTRLFSQSLFIPVQVFMICFHMTSFIIRYSFICI